MSKSLKELTYSVLEAVSSFNHTDDFPITNLWIEDQLITQNMTLIRKANDERRLDQTLYMLDEKLEIKSFNQSFEIEGISINNHTLFCYADLKPLISGLKGKAIDFVSNVDYSVLFVEKSLKSLLRGPTGYLDLPKPSFAFSREYLLFRKSDIAGQKYVNVNGLWRDPRQVSSWSADDEFPTPSERNLEILTVQHIGQALGFPPDLISDAQRVLAQPPKQKERDAD